VLIGQELGLEQTVWRYSVRRDPARRRQARRTDAGAAQGRALTPEERRVIELHPEYGHEMVRGIGFLGEARRRSCTTTSAWTAAGIRTALPVNRSRVRAVVAVADAFDAMTSTRSYSRARPVGTAVAELERCAGRSSTRTW